MAVDINFSGEDKIAFNLSSLKGYAKLTIYALILVFFILYQLYFVGNLSIIFAATPIIFAATDVTPTSPTIYNASRNISFSINVSVRGPGGARVDANGTIFQIGRNITTSFTNITRCTPIAGGGGLPQAAGIACVWNKTPSVFVINFTQQAYDEAGLSNYTWYANDSSGAGNMTSSFPSNYTIYPAISTLVISNNTASLNTSSLVGYWRFEEGSETAANDSSGNGNSGTLGNATGWTVPTWTGGMFGNALNFNGSQFVNISDSASLNITGNIALAAWVYTNSTSSSQRIIGKFSPDGSGIYMLRLGAGYGGAGKIDFFLSGVGGNVILISASTLSSNTWYHVVGTYDGSNEKLYINGVLDNSTAATGTISESAGTVNIGANAPAGGGYFNGTIDEPQIWNRALTADEIYELYQSKVNYPTSTTFTGSNCPTSTQGAADVTCNLYRNQTLIAGGSETATLGAGWTYYVYNSTGGANYTSASILLPLNISKGNPTIALSNNTAAVNNSNLLLYWEFDEGIGSTVADSSGNGNNGVFNSLNTTWASTGMFGNAVLFNGSNNNYVKVSNNTFNYFINTSSYTWTAWINMLNAPTTASLGIMKKETGGQGGYSIRINQTTQNLRFRANHFGETVSGASTINTNTWYHIAVVYYGNLTGQLFVNGVSDAIGTFTEIDSQTTGNFVVSSDNDLGRFNGTIDEVQMWNRSLTPSEIYELYQSQVTYPTQTNFSLIESNPGDQDVNYEFFRNGTISGDWHFDEGSGINAFDSSGNGNSGTISGAAWTSGMFGSALNFDGVDDYISAGNDTIFNISGEITVSAWVYSLSAPASEGRTVVSRYRYNSDAQQYGWNLGATWTGNSFGFVIFNGSSVSGWAEDSNFFTTKLNRWVHVVGVYKPSQYVYLYEDGVLVDSDTTTPINILYNLSSTNNVTIGSRSGNAQSYFNGTIDEVKIYTRALSAAEILCQYGNNCTQSIYNNETAIVGAGLSYYVARASGGQNYTSASILLPLNVSKGIPNIALSNNTASVNTSQLAGYWKFDEGTGTSAFDSSGNGNTGTLIGNATWNANGMFGNAVYFNGSQVNYVQVSNNPSIYFINTSSYTWSAWINFFSSPSSNVETIIRKQDGVSTGYSFRISTSSQLHFRSVATGTGVTGATILNPNSWYHIAAVYYGNDTARVFVNGVSDGVGTFSYINDDTSSTFRISDIVDSGRFNGTIDEVQLWNRSLTPSEIYELYQSRATYPTQTNFSLVESNPGDQDVNYEFFRNGTISGDWHFDEGTGNITVDSSGNGNTGNLTNNPTWTAGKYDHGLNFNGNTNYVDAGNASSLAVSGDITLVAWINPNNITTEGHIIDKRTIWNSPYGYAMFVAFGNVYFEYGNGTSSSQNAQNVGLTTGAWQQVAITLSGGTIKYYRNGAYRNSNPGLLGGIGVNTAKVGIGNSAAQNDYYFNGTIDEVKIYPRVLSDAEILCNYGNNCTQSIYNNETAIVGAGLSYYVARASGGQNYTSSSLLLPLNVSKGIPNIALSNNTASVNTSQLAGYWKFDEGTGTSAFDSSGNGNDGSLGGNATWTSNGIFGSGVYFNESQVKNYVSISNSLSTYFVNSSSYTWNAWVKPSTSLSYGAVLFRKESGASTDGGYIIYLADTGVDFNSMSIGGGSVSATATLPTNAWSHIAVVYYGNKTLSIYVNGQSITTGTLTNVTSNTADITQISSNWNPEKFNGTIDEVQIWNRSLSASEVRELYQSQATYPTQTNFSLVESNPGDQDVNYEFFRNGTISGNWHLDEGSGSIAVDSSGNGNTGTLIGNATWTSAGKYGNAVFFNGSTVNYVYVSNAPSNYFINTSSYTWSAWINMFALSTTRDFNILRKSDGSTMGWGFFVNNTITVLKFVIYPAFTQRYGTTALNVNTWYHVAVVYYGNRTVQFFVNGVSDGAGTFNNALVNDTQDAFQISSNFNQERFNGTIDEVKIYPRALSASEILCQYGNNCTQSIYNNETGIIQAGLSYYVARASGGQNYTASSILLPLSVSKGNPTIAISNNTAPVNTSQLLGYWNFNENNGSTAYDSSGNGNTGTLQGNATWNTSGRFGSGIYFNGSQSNYVDAGNNPSLYFIDTSSYTWTAWINMFSTPPANNEVVIRKESGGTTGYLIRIRPSLLVEFHSQGFDSVQSNTAITLNNWYHIAVVYYGNRTGQIFINGISDATGAFTTINSDTTNSFRIGSSSSPERFNGTIDEVQVWNRTLTPSEIDELYQSQATYPTQTNFSLTESNLGDQDVNYEFFRNGTISGDWHFDEGSGNLTFDSSGNGNTGALGNTSASAVPTWTAGKFGSGLQFDGVDDEVAAPNPYSLSPGSEGTVELWARRADTNRVEALVVKDASFYFNFNGTNNLLRAHLYISGAVHNVYSNTAITDTNWHHLAMVWNTSGTTNNVLIYIDGVVDATGNLPGAVSRYDWGFYIGSYYDTPNYYFNGTIDEVKIYSRALSSAEILCLYANNCTQSIYNNETGIIQAGLSYYVGRGSGGQNWTIGSLLLPLNVSKGMPLLNLTLNVSSPISPSTGYQAVGGNCTMLGGLDITCTLYRGNSTFTNSTTPNPVGIVTDQGLLSPGVYVFNFSSITGQNWTSASASNFSLTVGNINPRNASSGISVRPSQSRQGLGTRTLQQPIFSNPVTQRLDKFSRILSSFFTEIMRTFSYITKFRAPTLAFKLNIAVPQTTEKLSRNIFLRTLFNINVPQTTELIRRISVLQFYFASLNITTVPINSNVTPTQNVWVQQGNPNTNWYGFTGGGAILRTVNDNGGALRGYIRFNLTAANISTTSIQGATVSLYQSGLDLNEGNLVGVYEVTDDAVSDNWNESFITWNNQPCGSTGQTFNASCNTTVGDSVTISGAEKNYNWNVMQFAQRGMSRSSRSFTLVFTYLPLELSGPDLREDFASSRNSTTYAPVLYLNYSTYVQLPVTRQFTKRISVALTPAFRFNPIRQLTQLRTSIQKSIFSFAEYDVSIFSRANPLKITASMANSERVFINRINSLRIMFNINIPQTAEKFFRTSAAQITLTLTPSKSYITLRQSLLSITDFFRVTTTRGSIRAAVQGITFSFNNIRKAMFSRLPNLQVGVSASASRVFKFFRSSNLQILMTSLAQRSRLTYATATLRISDFFTLRILKGSFRSASQALTFSFNNIRTALFSRLPKLQVSISTVTSRMFLFFRNPSLQILMNSFAQRSRTTYATASLRISDFFALTTLRGSARTAFQALAFSFGNSQRYLFGRFPNVQINFTQLGTRMTLAFRNALQQTRFLLSPTRILNQFRQAVTRFTFTMSNLRQFGTLRVQTLAVLFNINVPQTREIFSRNPFLNIIFTFNLPRAAGIMYRNVAQSISFTAFAMRIAMFTRTVAASVNFTTFVPQVGRSFLRIATNVINLFSNVPQTTETFSRNPALKILFSFNAPRGATALYRTITQSISFTAFATRIATFARTITTYFNFSAIVPQVGRSSLRIATTFINFFTNVPQTKEIFSRNPFLNILFNFNIPRAAQSLYKNVVQPISFNTLVTRIATFRRVLTASFNLTAISQMSRSFLRTANTVINFFTNVPQTTEIFRRNPVLNILFSLNVPRAGGLLYRTVSQSISFSAFATRIATFTRTITTYFNFSFSIPQAGRSMLRVASTVINFFTNVPQTTEIFSRNPFLKIIFSFNIPQTVERFSRNPTLNILFTAVGTRIQSIGKTVYQSFSFNLAVSRFVPFGRIVSQALRFNMASIRNIGFLRTANQVLSFSAIPARALSLMRTVNQSVSVTAFATRAAAFGRVAATYFNFTTFSQAGRSLQRSVSSSLSFFISVPRATVTLSRNPILNILFSLNVPQTTERLTRNPTLNILFTAVGTRIQTITKSVSANILFTAIGTRVQTLGRMTNLNLLFTTAATRIQTAGRQAFARILFTLSVPQTRELFSRISTLSITFNFRLAQLRETLVRNVFLNILFTANVPQARQILSRNPFVNILFSPTASRVQSLYRTISQSISLTAFATRIVTFSRFVATSFNFTAIVPSVVRSSLRIATSVINFFTNVPQTTELFRRNPILSILFSFRVPPTPEMFARNPTLNILFTTVGTRIQLIARNVNLNILFTTFRFNFANISRFANLNILFTSATTRVLTASRQISARILFNFNIPQTIELFRRNPVLSIFFTFRVPSSAQLAYRNIVQSFTFNFLVRNIYSLSRVTTLTQTFTAFATRILSAGRTVAQSITLKAFVAGLSGIGRTVSQNIVFSLFNSRTLLLARAVPLSINVSTAASRMFGILRTVYLSITTNAVASRVFVIGRLASQSLNFNAVATRTAYLFRVLTNPISFTSTVTRMLSANRLASQSFYFNFLTKTLLGSARSVAQRLTLSTSTSRIFTAFRTSSQAIYFTALTRGGFSYFAKIVTQQISFTAISSRISLFTRTVATSFRFVALVPQAAGQSFQRAVSALINFLTNTQRIATLARNPILNVLFSFNVPRGFGTLYRNVAQAISFNAFATRMAAFGRAVTTQLNFFLVIPQAAGQSFSRVTSTMIRFFAVIQQPQQLLSRNPFLRVLFAGFPTAGQTLFRTLSLNILFTTNTQTIFTEIQNIFNATASTSFNFISGTSKAFLNVRLPIQASSFSAIGTRMLLLFRASALQQNFAALATRITTFGRLVATSFRFTAIVSQIGRSSLRIATTFINFFANIPQPGQLFFRSPVLNVLFSFNVPRGFGFVYRTVTQQLSFSAFAARIATFQRTISENFVFSAIASRVYGISGLLRIATTGINFSAFSSRALGLARAATSVFNFNAVLNTLIGTARTVTQSFSTSFAVTSSLNLLRTAANAFNFASAVQRTLALARSVSQSFAFSSLSERFFVIGRTASQMFAFSQLTSYSSGVLRIAAQSFTANFVVSTASSLFRSVSQPIILTFASLREFLGFRAVSSSITLLSQTTTQMSRLREAFVVFQLNNIVSRSLLAFRQSTSQIVLIQGVQRQLSLFRQAVTSLLTFPTASRIFAFFRTIFGAFQIFVGVPAANVTTGTTTTITASTSATSQPPGGGGGIPPIAPLNISFEPSSIVERLGNGEKDIVGLKVSNNGDFAVQVNLRLPPELTGYVTLDRTSFTVGPKSEELVRVSIAIPPEEASHAIEGSIVANVNGVTYDVPVTLIVTSRIRFLLDVRTEIPDAFRTVSAGGKVQANITIFNLGQEGRVDVDLMYGVRNSSTILATREEFLAVRDKVSLMRTIDIPRGTAPGTYQFFANASYANATAKSFSEFNVLTPQQIQLRLFTILLLALLAGAIFLIIAVAYRRKKKEQRTENIYAKIQKIRGGLNAGAERQLSRSSLLSNLSNIKLSLPKFSIPKFSIPYPKSSNNFYRREIYPAVIKTVKGNLENNFSYQFPEKERLLLSRLKKKLVNE